MEDTPVDFFAARPQPPLDAFVESIWAVRGASPYRRFTMLPNGAVQLMINFGAPHWVLEAGGRRRDALFRDAWFAGLQHGPLAIESPAATDLMAIRFRPGGAHAFMRLPIDATTDEVVDAEALLGGALRDLREQLAVAATRPAQFAVAERWLLRRLRPNEPDHALLTRAIDCLAVRAVPVRLACEQLGLGNERLIRLFRRLAGMSPKALARVLRFRAGLPMLAGGRTPHVDIALSLGYYDQAHFNREFRRLAGTAPGDFIRRRGEDNESLVDG